VLGELKSLPEGIEKGVIRVVCLSHMRKYDDALQLLDSLDTNIPLLRALRGLVLHKAGRIDDALEEYNEAVNEEPTLFLAWNNMGAIYTQRGQREEAQTCYENAGEIWKEYKQA
jgi:tetratricopeptide (TPR) repeat protein